MQVGRVRQSISELGGRKFILAVLIVILSAGAFAQGSLAGPEWAVIVTVIMGAFAYGNKGSHKGESPDE